MAVRSMDKTFAAVERRLRDIDFHALLKTSEFLSIAGILVG